MKKLLVLVLVLAISAPAFAWVDELDDYANGAVLNAAGTGGVWQGGDAVYNWVGDDYDGTSAACNFGANRGWAHRTAPAGSTEFGGRIRIAADSGTAGSLAYIGVSETLNTGDGSGYSNNIGFSAVSNQPGSDPLKQHFKFGSEMFDGGWNESRHDFGDYYYPGTTFPLTVGVWYDVKAVEISAGIWEGSWKAVGDSVWNVVGTVNAYGTFDTNYGVISGQTFARVGEIHVIPEPATMALLGLGALALIRRKR